MLYRWICLLCFSMPWCLIIHTSPYKHLGLYRNITWGVAQAQGNRLYQEDAYDAMCASDRCVFGVFDGHSGSGMSHALSKGTQHGVEPLCATLHYHHCVSNASSPDAIFRDWEQRVYATEKTKLLRSGATASCLVCDMHHNTGYVYNAGDSCVCIIDIDGTVYTSPIHTAHKEYQRVLNDGGVIHTDSSYIYKRSDNTYSIHQLYPHERFRGSQSDVERLIKHSTKTIRCGDIDKNASSLEPSRGFGDYYRPHNAKRKMIKKNAGHTVRPSQLKFDLSRVKAAVLITDGVGDSLSARQIRKHVEASQKHHNSPSEAAEHIVKASHSSDNKTALVVDLSRWSV